MKILFLNFGLFWATFLSSQSVGIGTTSPSDALHIIGNANDDPFRVQIGSATKLRVLNNGGTTIGTNNTTGTPANGLYVFGNTGLGVNGPTEKLEVNGNINLSGTIKPNGVAGAEGQVLTSNGNGIIQWLSMSSGNESNGNGSWGDCSMHSVEAYQPVNNENGKSGDQYGCAIKIDGNKAVIGMKNLDDDVNNQGAVIVYEYNTTSGVWQQKGDVILNQNPIASDQFGSSVDISGDYIIVGAPFDDEVHNNQGTASIFKYNIANDEWEMQGVKLQNYLPQNDDNFGFSVAISGDFAIVGAPNDNEGFSNSGSASIYKRNPSNGTWSLDGTKKINENEQVNDNFGFAVDIDGNTAIVGCPNDDEGITNQGSITIYQNFISTGWDVLGSKIESAMPNLNANFGKSVSINGNYAAVGTPGDPWDQILGTGSVTILKRDLVVFESLSPIIWPKEKYLEDNFGNDVSISGDYLLVGKFNEDEPESNQGAAIIYKRYGSLWRQIEKVFDPEGNANDQFGTTVAIEGSNQRFIIGEPNHRSSQGLAIFGKVK